MTGRDALSRTMGLCAVDSILADLEPIGDPADRDRLYALIAATRAPAAASELRGEQGALDAYRHVYRRPSGAAARRGRRRRVAVGIAGVVASLGFGTGLAAAGALPGPAQDFASHAFDVVGVHVPDSHGHRPGGVPPTSVPPSSTPPVSRPPVSTPAGTPATPRGDDSGPGHEPASDDHRSSPPSEADTHSASTPDDSDKSAAPGRDGSGSTTSTIRPDPGRTTESSGPSSDHSG